MEKHLTRFYLLLIISLLGAFSASAQTINVSLVDPGPYGQGSTISVHINTATRCIRPGNKFNLYLSDGSGSFSSNGGKGTLIGTFNDFYTTFVNGTIPASTPAGTGYRLRVETTSPAATSASSAAFSINAVTGVPIKLTSINIDNNKPEVFGLCENNNNGNTSYTINNETDAAATVTATITNELDNNTTPLNLNSQFSAAAAHYTITAKATANGVISTRSYLLVNNRLNLNAFRISEIQTACMPDGMVTFSSDLSNGASSLRNTFPGNIYTITWGDGLSNEYTVCEIIASGGIFSHNYGQSSCGKQVNVNQTTFYNSYGLTIRARNTYCTPSGASIAAVKVLAKASTNFTLSGLGRNDPLNACVGTVAFQNTSDPGDNPSSNSPTCKNPNARYNWYVNGTLFASNKTLGATDIKYNFTTAGTYTVRLVLISNSGCQSDPSDPSNFEEKTVCIQNPPTAAFNINGNTTAFVQCGNPNFTFRPTNTSTVDNSCQVVERTWSVTGPSGGSTINGSPNDNQPEITLTKPGKYTVKLVLKGVATCAESTASLEITLSTPPVAELKPGPIAICGGNRQIAYSNDPNSDFYVNLSGTSPEITGTYTWQVSTVSGGGTATLIDAATTKYPRIRFSGPGEYKVSVTHKNDCNPTGVTATHNIIIQNAPDVTVSTPPQANCPGDPVPVKSTVTGSYQTATWQSPGGGTFADANALETTYNPTQAEINAGEAIVNLVVTTNLAAPCNTITTPLTIKITPRNTITSPLTLQACSQRTFSYTIEATLPGSTFQWEIDPAGTSPFASGYPNSGTSPIIDGTIENTNPAGTAVTVTYIIRPVNSGCVGDARKLVITVIPSNPKIDFSISSSPDPSCGPTTVTFTNNSPAENGTYEWDFGDGSAKFTGQTPPPHTYQPSTTGAEQVYEISLKLISTCQTFTPVTKSISISPATPVAILEANADKACGTVTISLTNRSPGNNSGYIYLLLDENKNELQRRTASNKTAPAPFSVQPNPDRTIQVFVRMTAIDKCGNQTTTIDQPFTISPSNLVASMFIQNSPAQACTGKDVVFVNNSTGDTFSYKIYRSDGSVLEQIDNVPKGSYTYRFTEAGSYTVTVVPSTTGCGPSGESSPQPITIFAVPDVTFNADVENCNNLNYKFTISGVTDANTRYSWDFGDGTPVSLEKEPTHTYAAAGSYNVTLTVTNQLNCGNTISRPVAVNPVLVADFNVLPGLEISIPDYHFSFQDNSKGNAIAWAWDFGDNIGTSNARNPEYTYPPTQIGSHVVTLTVTDNKGCTSVQRKTVTISGTPGSLFLPNAFIPSNSSSVLQTFMAKGTGIKQWRMQIYNKWGQLVWETTKLGANGEPIDGWDGTYKGSPAPQGAYVWQVSATFINGTEWKGMSYGNSPPKRNGVVNLIR